MDAVPSDRQILDLIRQLHELERPAWWASALAVVMRMVNAHGGYVAVDDGALRVRAQLGEVPDLKEKVELPTEAGFKLVEHTAVLRVHHEVFPHDTLWVLFGCGEDPRCWTRLASLASHLQLAVDFTIRRGEGEPMPGRLRGPDAQRRTLVEAALSQMTERSAACALLAARGYTNGQIAEYLDLNGATVARALQDAYRHFGIGGRNELDVGVLLSRPKPPPAREVR